jgi:hypothetical protein
MNNKFTKCAGFLVFLFIYLTSGCPLSYVKPVDEDLFSKKFPFIENGKITKDEVLSKLDKPYRVYNKDRIWTYQIRDDNTTYTLVLVFDGNDLLSKHSLVKYE